jgi:hypothetical protein
MPTQHLMSLGANRFLLNVDFVSARRDGGERNDQQRPFSWELLMAFIRSIFTRSQTYVGLATLGVVGLILFRFSRAVTR